MVKLPMYLQSRLQRMSERNKSNKKKQEVNHICCRKSFQAVSYKAEMTYMKPNGQWVTNASAKVNLQKPFLLDKVKDVIAEKVQEIVEDNDTDPTSNAGFLQVVGEKSNCILGQGSGIKSTSRISRNEIQEKLKVSQKKGKMNVVNERV
ncbi:putative SKP1-like protein 1B-like [Capsicum annuum]|nr:putative SKP1-like protein 1B-like [Capsicum annuum]